MVHTFLFECLTSEGETTLGFGHRAERFVPLPRKRLMTSEATLPQRQRNMRQRTPQGAEYSDREGESV